MKELIESALVNLKVPKRRSLLCVKANRIIKAYQNKTDERYIALVDIVGLRDM